MKSFILTLTLFSLLITAVTAQESDTTKIRIGKKIITVIEKADGETEMKIKTDSIMNDEQIDIAIDGDDQSGNGKHERKKNKKADRFEGHWHGFEFGFNGLVNANNEFPADDNFLAINHFRSWTFGLNLFQKDIPLIRENFGIVTGLGMQWRNYHFENNIRLIETTDAITSEPEPESDFTKNRLQATYLTVPVAFELQFPVGKDREELFLMAGGYGSFKIGSNYKTKWEEGNDEFRKKIRDDYHLSRFEYGLTARIGYGNINLFANYALSPLFDKKKGPEPDPLYPVTVGIMIVGF
jgi:hypothetical protein